jgi:hypothetical protein
LPLTAALSAKMSLRVRASTMFPCRATRYSPYRAGPAHLTPVIERCPHIRGVAVRKILTCAHALEVAVHDPFSRLFSHTSLVFVAIVFSGP